MIKHVKNSFTMKSKLTPEILSLHGMSTPKIRHLLNNLVSMPGSRYLEVGLYKGATFISALYGNSPDYACGVDDGWKKTDLTDNTNKYIDTGFDIFWCDAFEAKPEGGINIYLYDASHTKEAQINALDYYYDYLADEFIYMVDDFNLRHVRIGTWKVIKDLGLKILYQKWMGGAEYSERVPKEWWLGFYICILRK